MNKEQIAKAREMELLAYLRCYEPGELIKKGYDRYTTKTHGSLIISKGKWIWNAGGVGGVSALDYLIKVRGMDFVSAVEQLAGGLYIRPSFQIQSAQLPVKNESKILKLPKKESIPNEAVSYLQKRGISNQIIRDCLNHGILYQSEYFNPKSDFHKEKVCVFVGKDKHGKERFATMRGINKDFKRDARGSDKLINFHVPAKTADCTTVAVFEAPIDLISHMTLSEMDGSTEDLCRLSLGGTAHVALISFLEGHSEIENITLCLDNDNAGQTAARNIKKILAEDNRFSHIKITEQFPQSGKDYNESLMNKLILIKKEKQQSRPNRTANSI